MIENTSNQRLELLHYKFNVHRSMRSLMVIFVCSVAFCSALSCYNKGRYISLTIDSVPIKIDSVPVKIDSVPVKIDSVPDRPMIPFPGR